MLAYCQGRFGGATFFYMKFVVAIDDAKQTKLKQSIVLKYK
jgi:hypothetical protein